LRMPLRYEVGPLGLDNPVGIDPTLYDEVSGSYRVPQLLPPDIPAKPGVSVPFTGVGPIAPSWRPRAGLLRAQDRAWLGAMLDRPIPTGFDASYFSIAPADQRATERFRHDERILLECLHPQHPRLVTNLSGVRPVLSSNLGGKLPSFTGDTLLIDSDRGVVTLTFRAQVEIDTSRQTRFEVHADGGRPRRSSSRSSTRFEESTMKLDGKTIDAVVEGLDTTSADGMPEAGSPLPFPATARKARLPSQAFDGLPFRTGADGPASSPRPRSEPAPLSVLGRTETLTDTADPLPSVPAPRTPPPLPPRAPLSRPPSPAAALVPPPPASVPPSMGAPPPPPPPPTALRPPSSAPLGAPPSALGGLAAPLAVSPPPPVVAPAPVSTSGLSPVGFSSSPLSTAGPRPAPPAIVPAAQTVGEQRAQLHNALPAVVSDERRIRAGSKEPARDDPFGAAFTSSPKSQPHASAKLASDEAAGRADVKPVESREPAREMTARKCLVDLLGCDPEVARRVRRSRTFSSLLAEFAPPRALRRLDDGDTERDRDREEKQRLDVLRVLSCGEPLDGSGLAHSLDGALDDPNDLEIPILLTAGDLKPTFDELEALKLAVKIAQ
ncbi:MAG: DUF2169 domain-containing protein, partial [Myxococcales bacterium]|nr:DUF2169 domain-containing protein [Myxococcales bacterium]